ncbi:hypothetical protein [Arthrobacter sp. Ld5]|uniref:hypothetical protein n=1 Tax=Arthrobacter sp. Ld5 TaxID=649152 RepID=UPI003EB99D54
MTSYPRHETVSFLRAAGAGYIEGLMLMRYAQRAVEERGLAARERVVHVEVWGEETCGTSYHQGHPVDLSHDRKAIYWYRVTIDRMQEERRPPPGAASGDADEGPALVEGSAAP